MSKQKESKKLFENVDILGSIEFDLTESIKDLIYAIKSIKKDVDMIKKELSLKNK